jgi:hypothetical protein
MLLPDLSEWNPGASLAGIKAANGGAVFLRGAYGADHPDLLFARYRAGAASLGYPFVGIYHYVRQDQDITAQARAFLKILGKLAPNEVPALDLEEGAGDQEARANAWHAVVDEALGLAPRPLNERSWLYSGLDFAETAGLAPIFASARHTWVAAYGSTEPSLGHTLWQSTNGTVGSNITSWPGTGKCDTNLYHGTLAELAALSGRYQPPAPAKPATAVTQVITSGTVSLAAIAGTYRTTPQGILAATAEHAAGAFSDPLAIWLNSVFAGKTSPGSPLPKGLTLQLPKS